MHNNKKTARKDAFATLTAFMASVGYALTGTQPNGTTYTKKDGTVIKPTVASYKKADGKTCRFAVTAQRFWKIP
jgi:hypothetical protein